MTTDAAVSTSTSVLENSSSSSWLDRPGVHATSLAIFASDLLALLSVSLIAVIARHLVTPRYHLSAGLEIVPFLLILLPGFFLQDLYPGLLIHPAEEMKKVFSSITVTVLIWASVTFLTQTGSIYSRSVFLCIWVIATPVIVTLRFATRKLFSQRPWWGVPTIVLGSGPAAQRVLRVIKDGRSGLRVKGVLSEEPVTLWPKDLPPLLGHLSLGPIFAKSRFAQYAILAMPQKSNTELRRDIQEHCKGYTRVLMIPDMTGLCSLGIRTREVSGEIGFEFRQRLFSLGAALAKRTLDILLCCSAIILLIPVLLVIAVLVKLTSRGPVLFGHVRYGLDGGTFKAWKFRTMVPGASASLAQYFVAHPERLPEWLQEHKLKDDPRVTRLGKRLRRLSLDELPQLLNVLLGQMSLVGPRPIVQEEIEKYGRGFELYRRVRPGITGLWQVSGRNNTSYQDRVLIDEYYVNNWSVWLDIYILVRTIKALVTADGAY